MSAYELIALCHIIYTITLILLPFFLGHIIPWSHILCNILYSLWGVRYLFVTIFVMEEYFVLIIDGIPKFYSVTMLTFNFIFILV